jgi:type IV pilus assembly protein PilV
MPHALATLTKSRFMTHLSVSKPVASLNDTQKRRHSVGFSLIEVMVTLVILSLGLLGIAGLLVSGVSNAASTEATAKANQLAADMADRMRANPTVAASGTSEYITLYGSTAASATGTLSIANQDKKDWLIALAAQLPRGDGKITSSSAGTVRKMEIEIRWNNCMGTISDTNKTDCINGALGQYKTVTYEVHL